MKNLLHDAGIMSAVISFAGVMICLWLMQTVARDFRGPGGWLRLCHRIAYAAAALVFAYNAYASVEYVEDPRWVDLLTYMALIVLVMVSGLRHKMAPRVVQVVDHTVAHG